MNEDRTAQARSEQAMARIEAALARIDAAAQHPRTVNTPEAGNTELMQLRTKHDRLRATVTQSLADLDALIAGQSR